MAFEMPMSTGTHARLVAAIKLVASEPYCWKYVNMVAAITTSRVVSCENNPRGFGSRCSLPPPIRAHQSIPMHASHLKRWKATLAIDSRSTIGRGESTLARYRAGKPQPVAQSRT